MDITSKTNKIERSINLLFTCVILQAIAIVALGIKMLLN